MSLFNRINTSTPATPSLFGATNSQPQQTPSLFSSTATPAGGLFGGGGASSSTPSTAAPASGGLFGAAPQQAPASTTGGGLFSPAPATAPAGGLFGGGGAAPAAGGLFGGAAPATTSAPAAGGGLFGGGAAPAATTTAAGGGLFGGAATAATGGGLFGTPAQKPVGSSLFSPAPATGGNALQTGGGGGAFSLGSSTAQKPGLFGLGGQQQGQQQQQQQQQQGQQQQQPGQQQQQQQNVIPAATVDVTRLTATTRFGDCHESVQMELEQLEKHIQDQIRAAQELSALFPRHRTTVESIPSDTKVLAHKLSTTKSFLAADQSTLQAAQQHHASDNDAATLSIRCLDLFRLPPQQRTQYFQRSEQENEVTSNGPMIAYFNGHAAAMDKKLRSFLESVGEVEASLRSVEQQAAVGASGAWVNREDLAGGAGGRQDAMKLNRTLREFNDALKDVSGRIVDVKDGLRELKAGGKR